MHVMCVCDVCSLGTAQNSFYLLKITFLMYTPMDVVH
jgi:hypothetical protein